MATYDLSGINYILPVFSFLLVVVVTYLILLKTEVLGENKFSLLFISFLIGVFFIAFSSGTELFGNIVPWFAILIVVLFFVLIIVGFTGLKLDDYGKGFMWLFVVLLGIVFIVSLFVVYNDILYNYLPGTSDAGLDSVGISIKNWLWSMKTVGTIVLIGLSALAAWILTRE